MLEIRRAAVPLLVSVTLLVMVCPTVVVPKLRLVVLSVTAASVPVPVIATVCGLPPALSVNERLALRAPLALGVNVTVTVH
jgi:hypothetical protein